MKTSVLTITLLAIMTTHAPAATLYVDLNSPNPAPPYATWSTAATNIQDAIDAAFDGDLVLVSNGVYQTGGRVVDGVVTNRVVIDKAVTLQSVNGSSVTIIKGDSVGNGIRCVYMTNGAAMIGFTVTGGGTTVVGDYTNDESGGGIWCESSDAVISNCIICGNTADYNGSGTFGGTYYNCTLITNSIASEDGAAAAFNSTFYNCSIVSNYDAGAYSCWLSNCTVAYNHGAGVVVSTANDCTIVGNSGTIQYGGGGALGGALTNCLIAWNSANSGGGAEGFGNDFAPIVLDHCLIASNSANSGGGVGGPDCVLYNCTLIFNSAAYDGGGAYGAELNNCIISNNTTVLPNGYGGGVAGGLLNNCILTGNSALNGGGAYGSNDNPYVPNAFLNDCTLSNNVALAAGGGAGDCSLQNCLVVSNSTSENGGGTISCDSTNCILAYNKAIWGGGDYQSTLVNCTVVGNSASDGGGAYYSTAENSIVYYNTAYTGSNFSGGVLNYCSTTPPAYGLGNITNAPLFVNLAGGDFHLQSQSPCINSGNNAYVTSATDLDGNPRIVGGTVDMGAYEYQMPVSRISYAWLQQYGLPITTNIDTADLDGTAFNVYQDWIAGLDPTNSLSVLAMLPPMPTNNPAGLLVSWESVSNRTYFLQGSTNLAAQPAFSTIQSNIIGQPDMTSFMDTNAVGHGPFFYRVGVQ